MLEAQAVLQRATDEDLGVLSGFAELRPRLAAAQALNAHARWRSLLECM